MMHRLPEKKMDFTLEKAPPPPLPPTLRKTSSTGLYSGSSSPFSSKVVQISDESSLSPESEQPPMLMSSARLEAWVESQCIALDIDQVFAPYLIGMIPSDYSNDDGQNNVVMIHDSILEVVMGWSCPENQKAANEFVTNLLDFYSNPDKLPQESSFATDPESLTSWVYNNNNTEDTPAPPSPNVVRQEQQQEQPPPLVLQEVQQQQIPNNNPPLPPEEDDFFWSVAHDLIDQLLYKFPEGLLHPQSLLEILKTVNMNMKLAIVLIKAILEKEYSSVSVTQVCRHFLSGECRRADCMFLHDTYNITCRFWLRGACTQSDSCIFYHGVHLDTYGISTSTNDYSDDEEDYSDLDKSNSSAAVFVAEQSPPDLSSDDKFPALGAKVTSSTSKNSLSLDFARALSFNKDKVIPKSTTTTTSSSIKRVTTGSTPWVSTGDAVSSQYKTLRAEASVFAKGRNECFMNATTAFRAGNKALATSLSSRGKELNARMKECHLKAANEIFARRNPIEQIVRCQVLDLHGLHVAEAIEFLQATLPTLNARYGMTSVNVVTGSGHHTVGPQKGMSRLKPAVERFLNTEGYVYHEIPDRGKDFVGMLLVHLVW